jgi:hypothetical protein
MSSEVKPSFEEVDRNLEKEVLGAVHGVDANPAAAVLAAATEAQKPRMFSKGMIRLWLIVRFFSYVLWRMLIGLGGCRLSHQHYEWFRQVQGVFQQYPKY